MGKHVPIHMLVGGEHGRGFVAAVNGLPAEHNVRG